MRQLVTISSALFVVASLAQEQPSLTLRLFPEDILQQKGAPTPSTPLAPSDTPTRRIVPDDIVHDSIQLFRFSTNNFAVRWTYTEAGARKILAFREAHEDQYMRIVIGSYESRPHRISSRSFTSYTEWKESWLKRRTDKIFVQSEQDAQKIVAGLKNK